MISKANRVDWSETTVLRDKNLFLAFAQKLSTLLLSKTSTVGQLEYHGSFK